MKTEYFAFCLSQVPLQPQTRFMRGCLNERRPSMKINVQASDPSRISRRQALITFASVALASTLSANSANAASNISERASSSPTDSSNTESKDESDSEKPSIRAFQTVSGLKYFDFVTGQGPTPKWGDLVNIQYVAYTISPNGESLVKQDSTYDHGDDGYLIHHGNGEMILGIEEALHTMSVGSRRRCIIPRNLAYYKEGFAPIPSSERKRRKFSKALRETGGTVVFDLELRMIMPDPDDRGYYTDLVPTDEELIELFNQLRQDKVPEGVKSITV